MNFMTQQSFNYLNLRSIILLTKFQKGLNCLFYVPIQKKLQINLKILIYI